MSGQRILFVDRDGTIIGTPEQNALVLETLRGVREAAA